MNEPRNSPSRRRQHLVICTIGAAVFFNVLINSGAFTPVKITKSAFPGGEFVYKTMSRDYAASMGLLRRIAADLNLSEEEWDDLLYNVYLDEEPKVPAGTQRFMGGVLFPSRNDKPSNEMKRTLREYNEATKPLPIEEERNVNIDELYAGKLYEFGSLPRVEAGVAQFPFTNGFVSALIHSYKVFPAMLKYGKEHGKNGSKPVVVTTCSIKQQMCTHYVPLAKGDKFLMGKLDTEAYAKSVAKEEKGLDFQSILKGLKKLNPFK